MFRCRCGARLRVVVEKSHTYGTGRAESEPAFGVKLPVRLCGENAIFPDQRCNTAASRHSTSIKAPAIGGSNTSNVAARVQQVKITTGVASPAQTALPSRNNATGIGAYHAATDAGTLIHYSADVKLQRRSIHAGRCERSLTARSSAPDGGRAQRRCLRNRPPQGDAAYHCHQECRQPVTLQGSSAKVAPVTSNDSPGGVMLNRPQRSASNGLPSIPVRKRRGPSPGTQIHRREINSINSARAKAKLLAPKRHR